MRITLVGRRHDKRAICWRGFFKLTLLVTGAGALLGSGIYALVAQRWNAQAPLAGAGAGLAASVITLLACLLTPFRRLPILGD